MSSLNGDAVSSGAFHGNKEVSIIDYLVEDKPQIRYEAISPVVLVKIVRDCVGRMIYVDQLHRCPFLRTIKSDGGLYLYSLLSMMESPDNRWDRPVHLCMDARSYIEQSAVFTEKTKIAILCMFTDKADENNSQVGLILTVSGRILEFHSSGHGTNRYFKGLWFGTDERIKNLFTEYREMAIEVIKGLCELAKKTQEGHMAHVEEWNGPNRFMARVTTGIDFNLPRLNSGGPA